ncbi:TIR domain-containing protein [Amycolatopsis sp. NBC_01286]|uniref:TIR domain-containing protein n=1 Tax=Amycolatopsis sp. NBC_01286 TaxID=2903560 RepID=UPI002E0FDB16|nr:nucleotide-binding protein [Amycolatopsis sp. NBC_01286]
MPKSFNEQLIEVATRLDKYAEVDDNSRIMQPALRMKDAAETVAETWSGSPLGYHANVYYQNFSPIAPGDHFSREWGFVGAMHRSSDNWKEYDSKTVQIRIRELAGEADYSDAKALSRQAVAEFETSKQDALSILKTYQEYIPDTYVAQIEQRVENLGIPSKAQISYAWLPRGTVMSRDSVAIDGGLRVAPHQEVLAEMLAIAGSFDKCRELKSVLVAASRHIARRAEGGSLTGENMGTNVFIGHGRSPLWRELKDFINERLRLPYDEFNRVPVAGVTNIQRLIGMLDSAKIAFLVLTAEDEREDGTVTARMNVVHEVGLFQGRLGFSRAIVMLEEGCEEFSNINGLGQIRFPRGNISAKFEEVRLVLEREGLIEI